MLFSLCPCDPELCPPQTPLHLIEPGLLQEVQAITGSPPASVPGVSTGGLYATTVRPLCSSVVQSKQIWKLAGLSDALYVYPCPARRRISFLAGLCDEVATPSSRLHILYIQAFLYPTRVNPCSANSGWTCKLAGLSAVGRHSAVTTQLPKSRSVHQRGGLPDKTQVNTGLSGIPRRDAADRPPH